MFEEKKNKNTPTAKLHYNTRCLMNITLKVLTPNIILFNWDQSQNTQTTKQKTTLETRCCINGITNQKFTKNKIRTSNLFQQTINHKTTSPAIV